MEQLDFVFFNTLYEQQNNSWLFEECLKHVHGDTVFVFEGIKTSRKMREFWREVCCHPEVTVTIDLYSMGIVFFNKKLHKRDYISDSLSKDTNKLIFDLYIRLTSSTAMLDLICDRDNNRKQ